MADAETVRTTRSGDRFHYLWASLRALRLLDWTSGLVAISVEGPTEGEEVVGEEIIDVAEYFGGADAASADRVRYHQLKHSSVRVDVDITSSELSKTLSKFAEVYREAIKNGRETAIDFNLVTNRRLGEKVRQTLTELASGQPLSHSAEGKYIRNALGFGAEAAAERAFCRRLSIEDGTAGVVDVERFLAEELKDFIRHCCIKGRPRRVAGDLPVDCRTKRSSGRPVRLRCGSYWRGWVGRHRPGPEDLRRPALEIAQRNSAVHGDPFPPACVCA